MDILKGGAGNGLSGSHMAMVDVRLQVSLRQVCSLATLNNATHEERASCALLNPLHRITTAKQENTVSSATTQYVDLLSNIT